MRGRKRIGVMAIGVILCVIMVLGAFTPLTSAQGEHLIIKGAGGPNASAVIWEYQTGIDPGMWTGHIVNNGLRSIIIDVTDITSGVATDVMHQRIRFAAYQSDIVDTNPVLMGANRIYSITATPMGPKGSSATITEPFIPWPPIPISFTYFVNHLIVTVEASEITDPDRVIVEYGWDWSDGAFGTGIIATHTYAASGTYIITLTTIDNYGLRNSVSKSVTVVANQPPDASFTWTRNQLTIQVDASSSYDSDGTIISYVWNWGDGSAYGSGVTASHTYALAGLYTITLTVTDDDGATDSVILSSPPPPPPPPVAKFTYTIVSMMVSVDASTSYDPDGTIVSYAWNWGDGSPDGSGVTASHTYLEVFGTYTITLTITDDDGLTGSMTRSITIS